MDVCVCMCVHVCGDGCVCLCGYVFCRVDVMGGFVCLRMDECRCVDVCWEKDLMEKLHYFFALHPESSEPHAMKKNRAHHTSD